VDSTLFDEQYNTFHSFGYAVEPQTGTSVVGNAEGFREHKGESVWTARDLDYKRKRSTAEAKAKRAAAEEASRAAAEALENGEAWSLVARAPWAEKVRSRSVHLGFCMCILPPSILCTPNGVD
jgi:pre-mRNA-processing factor 17